MLNLPAPQWRELAKAAEEQEPLQEQVDQVKGMSKTMDDMLWCSPAWANRLMRTMDDVMQEAFNSTPLPLLNTKEVREFVIANNELRWDEDLDGDLHAFAVMFLCH